MNNMLNTVLDKIKHKIDKDRQDDNVEMSERVMSVFSGGLLFGMGLKSILKHPVAACVGMTLGGALLYRGITGHSSIKKVVDKVVDQDKVTVVERHYVVKG